MDWAGYGWCVAVERGKVTQKRPRINEDAKIATTGSSDAVCFHSLGPEWITRNICVHADNFFFPSYAMVFGEKKRRTLAVAMRLRDNKYNNINMEERRHQHRFFSMYQFLFYSFFFFGWLLKIVARFFFLSCRHVLFQRFCLNPSWDFFFFLFPNVRKIRRKKWEERWVKWWCGKSDVIRYLLIQCSNFIRMWFFFCCVFELFDGLQFAWGPGSHFFFFSFFREWE